MRGRTTAAIFGTLAALVVVFSLVAEWSKQGWKVPDLRPTVEYKYVNVSSTFSAAGEISQLKYERWVVDDVLTDSCGNMTVIMRRPK